MYMIMLLLKKNCRDFFSFYNITLIMRNPKGISDLMITCSVNLSRHLKFVTKGNIVFNFLEI
jgi:hypothetical protein